MKKVFCLLLAAAMLMTVFVGCGPTQRPGNDTEETIPDDGRTHLTFYAREFEEWANAHVKELLERFNQEQSDIYVTVKFFTGDTYSDALTVARENGKAPDVYMLEYGSLTTHAKNGYAAALNDLLPQEALDDLLDNVRQMVTYKDKIYAYPWVLEPATLLFYRKDIFEELSISTKELETWDSILMTVLPKIQKSSLMVGILPTLQNYLAFLYQRGGTLYTADGRGSALNTPEGIAAMRLQSSLYTQYGLPFSFDFANRFRTGEMPLAVADYTSYNQLTVFAPEIKGQWGVLPVPGTKREDGTVDHTAAGTVTGCVMLAQTEKEDAAWAFMQWWTSADIQTAYGKELESVVGAAARYNSANRLTMERVQWSADMQRSLLAQSRYVRAVPEVPGGYFTSRHFDFAFRNIAYDNEDVRETLNDAVQDIDREILTKRREFGLEP